MGPALEGRIAVPASGYGWRSEEDGGRDSEGRGTARLRRELRKPQSTPAELLDRFARCSINEHAVCTVLIGLSFLASLPAPHTKLCSVCRTEPVPSSVVQGRTNRHDVGMSGRFLRARQARTASSSTIQPPHEHGGASACPVPSRATTRRRSLLSTDGHSEERIGRALFAIVKQHVVGSEELWLYAIATISRRQGGAGCIRLRTPARSTERADAATPGQTPNSRLAFTSNLPLRPRVPCSRRTARPA
jgi:hypothetical protein